MRIINPFHEILTEINGKEILRFIEKIGRVCYKSEDRITDDSAESFVGTVIKRGHESVLEHVSISVRFICDRGVSHEIVRHRIASYSQESTRYCNYSLDGFGNELTFIAAHETPTIANMTIINVPALLAKKQPLKPNIRPI